MADSIQPETLQGQITFSAPSSQTTLAGAGSALPSVNDEDAIRAKQLAKAEKLRLNRLAYVCRRKSAITSLRVLQENIWAYSQCVYWHDILQSVRTLGTRDAYSRVIAY